MNAIRIKSVREELELTQEEISSRIGCKRSTYSVWEINKNTIP